MIDVYLIAQNNVLDYIYKQYEGYDIAHYQSENISVMQIYKEYFSVNLLSNKKLLIIDSPLYLINKSNKLKKKETEVFEEILKGSSSNKIIYLVKKPINKTIDYIKNNIEAINYEENMVDSIQKDFLKANEIKIKAEDLKFLIENIDVNYDYFQELIKLRMFKGDDFITEQDIRKYTKLKIEVDIFNLIESIIRKDTETFIQIYEKLKLEQELKPEQILAIMYSQLRFFITVKCMRDLNFTDSKIISELKCSPYRLKFSNKLINSILLEEFILINEKVAKYDYLIKSGKTKEQDVILNMMI